MVHKLALLFGGVGAVGIVALALAFGGSPFPVAESVSAGGVDQLVEATSGPTDDATSDPQSIVDVIYIETPIGTQGSSRQAFQGDVGRGIERPHSVGRNSEESEDRDRDEERDEDRDEDRDDGDRDRNHGEDD